MTALESTNEQNESIADVALSWARRGFPVFPCKPTNKQPFTAHGFKDATTDEKIIRQWWQQFPSAMIGIPTGERSGIWALDPDAPDGADKPDGRSALREMEAVYGKLPFTHTHETPRSGYHYCFKWDASRPVKNESGLDKRGINVRGEGGYIIAPPSRRDDGKEYRFAEPLDAYKFADAPDWLYLHIRSKPERPAPSISERAAASVTRLKVNGHRPYADKALTDETELVRCAGKGSRNQQLNTSAFNLGTLIGAGELSDSEVINALHGAAQANGLVSEDGHSSVMGTIKSGLRAGIAKPRQIKDRPQSLPASRSENSPDHPVEGEAAPAIICATPYTWRDPSKIPLRDRLYGDVLIRRFVGASIAPGGVGKSSLVAAEALAIATGKNLLGVEPKEALRVWLWNLEDPLEETERKIQAAAKHYGLTEADIGGRLFVDSGRDQPLVIAKTVSGGTMIVAPVVKAIVSEIQKNKIDVIEIDPFVSCHEVPENDNQAQDRVAKEWARVAERGNCAVHLIHHTRKGEQEVTADSARGGKALTDACRVVRVLNRMTKEEGERAGIENHRLYFRTYNDKSNLAPPLDKSDWFKLHGVPLDNGPLGSAGDWVGVVCAWKWPDPLDGVTGADFDKAAPIIRSKRWRESQQAKDWVGWAVAEAMGIDMHGNKSAKARVSNIVRAWIGAGSLIIVDGHDEKRMPRKFVEVTDEA